MPIIKHIDETMAVGGFIGYVSPGLLPRHAIDEELVKPSDIKEHDSFTLYGHEAKQLEDILYAIGKNQSLESFLNEVSPDYLNLFLNNPMKDAVHTDLGKRFFTPVHLAAYLGNITALKELSAKGAKFNVAALLFVNGKPETQDLLFLAVANNQADVIEYLIKEKQFKTEKDYFNKLLYRCIMFGRVESAEKLLSFGADVNYRTPKGDTLLHTACELFMDSSIEWVLGKFHRRQSITPTITTKTERIVRLLLKNGVDHQTLKSDAIAEVLSRKVPWSPGYYKLAEEIKDIEVREIIQKLINANRAIESRHSKSKRENDNPSPSTTGIFKRVPESSTTLLQTQPIEDEKFGKSPTIFNLKTNPKR
jgi:hypothetical protein